MATSITNSSITLMVHIDFLTLILALLTAVASGLVGSFALMRKMTLAADSFSHIALPGLGLALLFSFNPVLGGAITLVVGALIIWNIEKFSKLNTDAVIGVLFALSLALGALLFSEAHELMETLFGDITPITPYEFTMGGAIALFIIWFIIKKRRSLVLSLVSKDLARTAGVSPDKLHLWFLLVFALTVLLGMKLLGVLLMGSLIIIPAAAARNVAKNLSSMLIVSSIVAVVSVGTGLVVAQIFAASLGPVIIIIASILFGLTLFARRT